MKLTLKQVEARLTGAWGKQAHLVAYHLHGNRRTYAATDHWIPLETSWVGGRQVFQPVGMPWPSLDNGDWVEAVTKAAALAREYFMAQRNAGAIRRLPRAQVIAEARSWTRLGDGADTWAIPSSSSGGVVYEVNAQCSCPDFQGNCVDWCKHRLARAMARRAEVRRHRSRGRP